MLLCILYFIFFYFYRGDPSFKQHCSLRNTVFLPLCPVCLLCSTVGPTRVELAKHFSVRTLESRMIDAVALPAAMGVTGVAMGVTSVAMGVPGVSEKTKLCWSVPQ